jgi:hypothetical protein
MTRPRRFRFGLLGESVRSASELMETARRAEAAGFATYTRSRTSVPRSHTPVHSRPKALRSRNCDGS